MNQYSISQIIICLSFFSIMGWVCEVLWCSAGAGKLVNRGFLSGPWCPIYGFGALFISALAAPFAANPLSVFLISVTVACVIEYFTGWLLETLFQNRWWDYSNKPFNLKGRVCLENAGIFGGLGLIVTYFLLPLADRYLGFLYPQTQQIVAFLLVAMFALDIIDALTSVAGVRGRVDDLKAALAELALNQGL